jgi:hypothetical protein
LCKIRKKTLIQAKDIPLAKGKTCPFAALMVDNFDKGLHKSSKIQAKF